MEVDHLIEMLKHLNTINKSFLGHLQIFDDGTMTYIDGNEPVGFFDHYDDFVDYYIQSTRTFNDVQ